MRFQVDRDVYLNTMWRYDLTKVVVRLAFFLAIVAYAMFMSGVPFFIVCSLFFGGIIGGIYARYQATRKVLFHPFSNGSFATRVMEFTPENFSLTSSNGIETKIPWKAFVMSERRGGFVFLYWGLHYVHVVPDVAFATPADRDGFFAFVESSVPWRGRQKLRDVG